MSLGYFPYSHEVTSTSLKLDNLNNAKVSDYLHLMESNKKSKGLTRRIKRFFRKRKSSKLHKEIMEFQKYSLICFIANPELPLQEFPLNGEKDLRQLFVWCLQQAWTVLSKVLRLMIKFLKKGSMVILRWLKNHPWMTAFATYMACALLVLHHLSKKFGRKLRWFDRLLVILMLLGIASLLALAIKNEAFSTIIKWLKSILLNILLALRSINSLLDKWLNDSPSNPSTIGDKSQLPETKDNFKNFLLFSTLIFVATRYLLKIYKRRLVGESPFTDIVIDFIECYTPSKHQMES
jgi:hypothetical protein